MEPIVKLICRTSRRNILTKREDLRLAEIELLARIRDDGEKGCKRLAAKGLGFIFCRAGVLFLVFVVAFPG